MLAIIRTLHFTVRTSHVTRPHLAPLHESHVTHHLSFVTRHLSHVARHTSHVTCHAGTHFTSSDFAAVSETYVPVVQLQHIVDRCVCMRACVPAWMSRELQVAALGSHFLVEDLCASKRGEGGGRKRQIRPAQHCVTRQPLQSTIEALFGIRHTSDVEYQVTSHTSHLTPHTSHLTPHTSHLTPHTSHPTPHMVKGHTSHLTLHTSSVTPQISGP